MVKIGPAIKELSAQLKRAKDEKHQPNEISVQQAIDQLINFSVKNLGFSPDESDYNIALLSLCSDFSFGNKEEPQIFELICKLAPEHPGAFDALKSKQDAYFQYIKQLAKAGHAAALQTLATVAYEATEILNEMARSSPDLIAPMASKQVAWPTLRSSHKKYNLSDNQERKLFESIGLGKKSGLKISSKSRFDPQNNVNQIAIKLLNYVQRIRDLANGLLSAFFNLKSKHNLGKTLDERAALLPELPGESRVVAKWWEVAKEFLLEAYPALDPISEHGFDEVHPVLQAVYNSSRQIAPSKHKGRILDKIERSFGQAIASRLSDPKLASEVVPPPG